MPANEVEKLDDLSPADEALACHDGDVRTTIETLIAELQFVREELAMATGVISRGFTRGWTPSFERK
jgi:hypothetical protein